MEGTILINGAVFINFMAVITGTGKGQKLPCRSYLNGSRGTADC